jgi:hypothetical protein
MNLQSWAPAVENQLAAYKLVDYLSKNDKRSELNSGWRVDRSLLLRAVPYMWSPEVISAVLEASKSIPMDTALNKWNLKSECSWWYFSTPLPFETLSERVTTGIRALAFGFLHVNPVATFPAGSDIDVVNRTIRGENPDAFKFGMPTVAWIDPSKQELQSAAYPIAPSQVFEWEEGLPLGEMLERTRASHRELYGPGGKWSKKPQLGEDEYMRTSEGVARFILAGIAWLNQKVLVTTPEKVERHRRKEIVRVMRREAPLVRVVSLRKAEHRPSEGTGESNREYSCRWVVEGHWRNQPCGPNHSDRRLTYILPYVKGPEDKPLRTSSLTKVYTVDR